MEEDLQGHGHDHGAPVEHVVNGGGGEGAAKLENEDGIVAFIAYSVLAALETCSLSAA